MRLYSLLVALVLFSCGGQECSEFKVGKFKLKGDQTGDIILERTADRQFEISEKEGYINEFELTWIDECNYRLVFEKTNKPTLVNLSVEDTMYVEIISCENNSCTTIARLKDLSFEVIQEKIN